MKQSFWDKLKEQSQRDGRTITALAPMANVTDPAFREIIAKYGKPDVTWTEFISADGLCSEAGRKVLLRELVYSEAERPIVAQLFSSHPEKMRQAAALVAELGFDGLDINMGCPDKTIEKQGAGAAHMKNPTLAKEVIRAAQEGVLIGAAKRQKGDRQKEPIPISVKTRIGYNKVELETWIPELLSTGIAALTVHARTRKEMSKVPARWEFVKRAVEIRDALQGTAAQAEKNGTLRTLILGNGDALDLADGEAKARATGADGVMFGRAIFGNPWLFARHEVKGVSEKDFSSLSPTIAERLQVMVEHTEAFERLLGDIKNFSIMKKHYKAYVTGWDGAKELRVELMAAESAKEVKAIVQKYLAK